MEIQTGALVIVLAYMVGMMVVGYVVGKINIKGSADYLVAGRRMGLFMVAFSLSANNIGGGCTTGLAQKAFGAWGVSAIWYVLAASLAMIPLAYFAPKIRKTMAVTIPEVVGRRFGKLSSNFTAVLSVLSLFCLTSSQIGASGAVINALIPSIPLNVCLLLAGFVTIFYTTFGGMIADQLSDLIQFGIILVGLAIADDAEYMVLAAVDAVAQCCAGGSGHTLAQRAGSEVDTGGQLAVGVAGELGMRLVKGIGLSHGISEDGVGAVVRGLVLDGIVAGVGAVLGFVPQMLVLFLMLAFLEACGYMARIAFVLDRVFRKFGLSGKSFIPMLIGTGCGIPGIMASRTIENERDRRMTIMTTTFIPCGAKVPFIAMIAGAIFGGSAWVATSAYFIGMLAIITSGIMLKKTKMFAGDPAPFVMELPAYHLPTLKNVLRSMWERGWSFIKKAGTIILLSTILVWFTTYFGFTSDGFRMLSEEEPDQSILAAIGAIRREMNNAKWTWFAIAYQCGFAYAISLMINQFGGLFTGNVNIIGVIAAVIVLGFMIWMLVRPYKESTKLTKEIKVS